MQASICHWIFFCVFIRCMFLLLTLPWITVTGTRFHQEYFFCELFCSLEKSLHHNNAEFICRIKKAPPSIGANNAYMHHCYRNSCVLAKFGNCCRFRSIQMVPYSCIHVTSQRKYILDDNGVYFTEYIFIDINPLDYKGITMPDTWSEFIVTASINYNGKCWQHSQVLQFFFPFLFSSVPSASCTGSRLPPEEKSGVRILARWETERFALLCTCFVDPEVTDSFFLCKGH
jgi:hypothetical protein